MSSVPRVGIQRGCRVPRGCQKTRGRWACGSRKARMRGAVREAQELSWLCAFPGVPKVNLCLLLQTLNTWGNKGDG